MRVMYLHKKLPYESPAVCFITESSKYVISCLARATKLFLSHRPAKISRLKLRASSLLTNFGLIVKGTYNSPRKRYCGVLLHKRCEIQSTSSPPRLPASDQFTRVQTFARSKSEKRTINNYAGKSRGRAPDT